jgi:hypothetical protein
LQVLDTGMLNYFVGIQKDLLGTEDLSEVYGGTMIEHLVGQELLARQYSALHSLNFWVREKKTAQGEVDYLYNYGGKLIPIEVKSGGAGKLRSLHQFMELAPHNMAIRFYGGELAITEVTTPKGKKFQLLNLPYFLVSQIEDYIKWFEDKNFKDFKGEIASLLINIRLVLLIFAAPCPGGEIGRRTVFRSQRRKVCWFESSPGHHKI